MFFFFFSPPSLYHVVVNEKFVTILGGKGKNGLLDGDIQQAAFRHLAVSLVTRAGKRVEDETKLGKTKDEVWNDCMMDLVLASKVKYYFFHLFFFFFIY